MKLQGLIVPTLTPMNATGETLNLEAVEPLVDFLIAHGVAGLFVTLFHHSRLDEDAYRWLL